MAVTWPSGADRSQTVMATDRLIARYKAEGYEFVTVPEMMEKSRTVAIATELRRCSRAGSRYEPRSTATLSRRKGLLRGRNRFLNVFFGVSGSQEGCLELRGRQIHAAVEHGAEEAPKRLGVGLRRRLPIGHRTSREEPGKHRSHAVVAIGDARCFRRPRHSSHQFAAQFVERG